MIKLGEYHKRRNRLSFKTGSPIMWIGKNNLLCLGKLTCLHQKARRNAVNTVENYSYV